jgi:hypothetical protein
MKRLVGLLLAVAMLVGLLPLDVASARTGRGRPPRSGFTKQPGSSKDRQSKKDKKKNLERNRREECESLLDDASEGRGR